MTDPVRDPHFSAAYWGGMSLAGNPELPMLSPAKDSRIVIAAAKLGNVLRLGSEAPYDRTFEPGDHLQPNRYGPGRVFILNQEMLFATMPGLPDMDGPAGQTVPEQPTDLDPPLGAGNHPNTQPRYTIGGGVGYENKLLYAVVTPKRSGRKHTISFNSGSVRHSTTLASMRKERPLKVVTEEASAMVMPPNLEIGRAYRLLGKDGYPRLLRVTAAALFAPVPHRQKHSAKEKRELVFHYISTIYARPPANGVDSDSAPAYSELQPL